MVLKGRKPLQGIADILARIEPELSGGIAEMKKTPYRNAALGFMGCMALALFLPAAAGSQPDALSGPPPIAAPLVREGDLAVRLALGLSLDAVGDEIEAENRLADAGISPRNGWVADYPVTPDIIGELREAVFGAAGAGRIPVDRDEAIRRFNNVLDAIGLTMDPYSPSASGAPGPSDSSNYPNPSAVNDYYNSEGPPIVTSYIPPPEFYYLYAWVPFPFWWSGFWFPGYYILNDFHRTVIVNRRPVYVSNHFRDIRERRVHRIDPVTRYHGRSFGGIGAARSKGLLSTGVPQGERKIFNNPPPRNVLRTPVAPPQSSTGGQVAAPPQRGSATGAIPPRGRGIPLPAAGGASPGSPAARGEVTIHSAPGGSPAAAPSRETMTAPPLHREEAVRPLPPSRTGGGVSAGRRERR